MKVLITIFTTAIITCVLTVFTLNSLNQKLEKNYFDDIEVEQNIPKEVCITDYEGGYRRLSIEAKIDCGIFQFKDVEENSPQAKLNIELMREFVDSEKFITKKILENLSIKESYTYNDTDIYMINSYYCDLRARTKIYLNNDSIFSAQNEIYLLNKWSASVIREGINFKILDNGNIEKIELKDLFKSNTNWLDPLLKKAMNVIKETNQEEALWTQNAEKAISEILNYDIRENNMPKEEYYIYSFALKEESLVLVFQRLSIMPNASGYPIIEIPYNRIKHLKELGL